MRRALLSGILFALLPAAVLGQSRKAPDLRLKDLRGRVVSLSRLKGKVVLLNFWATWCPPCLAEVPDLIRWQRDYGSRGLQVVGITYPPTERAKVVRFVRRLRVNYPILLGTKETKALFAGGETLPTTVIIDPDGNVRENIEGILLPDEFDEKIKPLLKPPKP